MEDWNVEEQLKSGQWTVHGLALAYCSIQPNAQGGEHRGSEIVPLFWLKNAIVWVLVSLLLYNGFNFDSNSALAKLPHWRWWIFLVDDVSLAMSPLWWWWPLWRWCLFGDDASLVVMPLWWWCLFGNDSYLVRESKNFRFKFSSWKMLLIFKTEHRHIQSISSLAFYCLRLDYWQIAILCLRLLWFIFTFWTYWGVDHVTL